MCQIFAGQSPRRYENVTRRLRLNGQSTSIRLERAFWGILDQIAREEGLDVIAWRDVPTNPSSLGHTARSVMPRFSHLVVRSAG